MQRHTTQNMALGFLENTGLLFTSIATIGGTLYATTMALGLMIYNEMTAPESGITST